jgi:outer membrane biosynthesis protein TonB
MRLIAIAAAGILFASANIASASPTTPELKYLIQLAQAAQPKANPEQKNIQQEKKAAPAPQQKKAAAPQKQETMTQKVKRTWRNWTSPSHTFCVRTPIPVPLTSKTCTAKGKTVEEARAVCVQQNPLSYVSQGKC